MHYPELFEIYALSDRHIVRIYAKDQWDQIAKEKDADDFQRAFCHFTVPPLHTY